MEATDVVNSINTLSSFLASQHVAGFEDLETIWTAQDAGLDGQPPPANVIVLCGSAILHTAETVFSTLQQYKGSKLNKSHRLILVICGGKGHSTQLLHDAIAAHPKYRVLVNEVSGFAEARVLELIAVRFFGLPSANDSPLHDPSAPGDTQIPIVVEEQSTNCGANASETKGVLDNLGLRSPRTIVVCQDPTMCRRTVASFQHVYSGLGSQAPVFYGWPTFIPKVVDAMTSSTATTSKDRRICYGTTQLDFDCSSAGEPISATGLWTMPRFLDLILGEVPRLRNDENGYGPNGKGFIGAVDIPDEVEAAWKIVSDGIQGTGAEGSIGGRAKRFES